MHPRAVLLYLVVSLVVASGPALAASGAPVNARSRVFGHSFVDGTHHAWGKIRIWLKKSSDRRRVHTRCHVIVIWTRKGTKYESASGVDYVTVTVRPKRPRMRHFNASLWDPQHLYENIPGRWDTGCR